MIKMLLPEAEPLATSTPRNQMQFQHSLETRLDSRSLPLKSYLNTVCIPLGRLAGRQETWQPRSVMKQLGFGKTYNVCRFKRTREIYGLMIEEPLSLGIYMGCRLEEHISENQSLLIWVFLKVQ